MKVVVIDHVTAVALDGPYREDPGFGRQLFAPVVVGVAIGLAVILAVYLWERSEQRQGGKRAFEAIEAVAPSPNALATGRGLS